MNYKYPYSFALAISEFPPPNKAHKKSTIQQHISKQTIPLPKSRYIIINIIFVIAKKETTSL